MKEATGELNLTVVVVMFVAVLAFFFFSVLWPRIQGNYRANTKCDDAICQCPERDSTGKCKIPADGMVDCKIKNSNETIRCTWKG